MAPGVDGCPEGLEMASGHCFVKCAPGFQGFGPFCFPKESTNVNGVALVPYQRGSGSDPSQMCPANQLIDGDCMAPCPAGSHAFANTCMMVNQCPPKLPHNCGLVCTKDVGTCTTEIASLSVTLFQALQQAQNGNWPAVFTLVQKVYQKVSKWPKCSVLKAPEYNDDVQEVMAHLMKLFQTKQ